MSLVDKYESLLNSSVPQYVDQETATFLVNTDRLKNKNDIYCCRVKGPF
jgi:hypothetical protein